MARRREKEYEPVTVPFAATPAGEPPSIRQWANPCVWTERMLTTLEQGVQGGPSALAECLLRRAGVVQPECSPCAFRSILPEVRPSTGEPDAGKPPVRFGGRGGRVSNRPSLPLSSSEGRSPGISAAPRVIVCRVLRCSAQRAMSSLDRPSREEGHAKIPVANT